MERLKNIAVIIGLILSLVTLWTWGSKFFRHELVLRVEGGAFALPPQLDTFYTQITSDLSWDKFVPRVLADDSVTYYLKDLKDDAKANLVRRMVYMLPSVRIPSEYDLIHSYCTGTVTNTSSATITAVQIYLNGAKFSLLNRQDNSKSPQAINNVVSVGDLQPGEAAEVSIWSTSNPKYLDSKDVKVTHSSGVGRVIIPRSVTGIPALLDKYDFLVYMLLLWLFLGLVVPLAVQRLSKFRSQKAQQ